MRIIILGCGRVGSGLAQAMYQRGHTVTVVDKDPAHFERLGTSTKVECVTGVEFDRQVLEKAGIEQADGLAAVTPSDEVNVLCARIAREVFRVPRVVARLYDPRQSEIYRRLGLQTITPVTWGINRIADLLLYSPLEAVFTLGSGDVELIEVEATPLLVGHSINNLIVPGEIHVIAITHSGKTFLPSSGTVIQTGDLIHLAIATTAAGRLNDLLGQ